MEAVGIIRDLFDGGYVSRQGEHFTVDSAKLWDLPDRRVPIAAAARAHRLFRWSMTDWKVNAELPGTAGFASASRAVRPGDVAEKIPCGDDVGAIVKAAQEFFDAGYTDLALVQIGDDAQASFLAAAESEILPALRG